MAPTTQKAIVITKDGVSLSEICVPKPGRTEILVRVVAAAQNPGDWNLLINALINEGKIGGTAGCDFAGMIEEIGEEVDASQWTAGEGVAGFVLGGPSPFRVSNVYELTSPAIAVSPKGTFAEYVIASAQFGVVKIPDNWTFEQAAHLGAAPFTALQMLYQSLELPSPLDPVSGPQRSLLVRGGASSVGQFVIQFAKLGGMRVLATASPKNFDLVRRAGADEVFDYRDPEVVQKIRSATANALKLAVDTVSYGSTPQDVTGAIGASGGKVAIVLPYESPRADVTVKYNVVFGLLGEDLEHSISINNLYRSIVATNKLKPNPLLILPRGLASVTQGFQYLKDGKVSAQKLTYRIADTPKAL
ncbi:dehydrogenase [Gloeopeniophorella convolvens]|nr:dehydrogenase [Gloeopeniophorella convolvens]